MLQGSFNLLRKQCSKLMKRQLFWILAFFHLLVLLLMSKDTIGTEHINTQTTNVPEIKGNVSTITYTDVSMPTIPKAAFKKLSECKTLVLINTKTIRIDVDAWLGLNNLESLSIEGSYIRTLDTEMFNHMKSLTRLKVTTIRSNIPWYFPRDSEPLKPGIFRGLDSLYSLWLSLPNLKEDTIRSKDHSIWQDLTDTLTELILPGNDFRKLYDYMFIQYPNVEKLSFHDNRITTISSKALNGLELLREIDLSQNRINELDSNTFQSLTFLCEINLAKNRIEFLADHLFKGLKQLRILKLSNNHLKIIGCNVFDPMDFTSTGGHPGKIRFLWIIYGFL